VRTLENASYEQLQAMLAQRRVSWQRLEIVGEQGEWKFTCAIPDAGNPDQRRVHEGRAVGSNGLPAIRAVLAEIDRTSGGAASGGR
jgi:hypothetical protein